jgi:hypothetical protein
MSEQILKSEFVDSIMKRRAEFEERFMDPDCFTVYKAIEGAFEPMKRGHIVAEISGARLEHAFLAKHKVGDEGKVIVIDREPDFPYKLAIGLVGSGKLGRSKDYYVNSVEGRKTLQDCFSEAGFYVFGNHIPPYPSLITDNSLDHVIAVNAIKTMSTPVFGPDLNFRGPEAKPESMVEETYRKLKVGGTLTALSYLEDDINSFDLMLYYGGKKGNFSFEEKPMERNIGWKWKRYVKIPKK